MPRGTIAVLPIERKGKHEKKPEKMGVSVAGRKRSGENYEEARLS
jgi:hypothetical protein